MFETLTFGVIATAFGAGLRHGADWDHIAAIADISGTQVERRRSMVLSFLYAIGHATVVLALGTLAIVFGEFVPASIDSLMGRIVGITLVALGTYLLISLIYNGRNFRMRSRWMLLGDAVTSLKTRWRLKKARYEWVAVEHEHPHDHDGHGHGHDHSDAIPAEVSGSLLNSVAVEVKHAHTHTHAGMIPVSSGYGGRTAFLVGMLHGVGAETPTQVLIFITAAGIGGRVAGAAVLMAFVLGLVLTNTLIAAAATFGFLRAETHFPVYAAIGGLTAVASIVFGVLLLLNMGDSVPSLFG